MDVSAKKFANLSRFDEHAPQQDQTTMTTTADYSQPQTPENRRSSDSTNEMDEIKVSLNLKKIHVHLK